MENPASYASPIARRAEQTVLLPVHKSVPSNRVSAFFQEGLEKSTEKGKRTDKMLCDRESIAPVFFVSAKEYAWWGALYQVFICTTSWLTSASEEVMKLYKVEILSHINLNVNYLNVNISVFLKCPLFVF